MLTAYYLCHGLWTVNPAQLEADFSDMAENGFDAVAVSFSESEMRYSRRAFEIQVRLAKKHGLKFFAVPSRLGGRFAGAPLMPSLWLASHPYSMVPADYWMPVACVECEDFRNWIKDFLGILCRDYELDGIIWDEPKAVDLVSHHPATLAKYGPNPTTREMQDGFLDFLNMLTDYCLSIRKDLSVTLFTSTEPPEYFTANIGRVKGVKYFGYDGTLCRQSFFHEKPFQNKYRLETVWERTVRECEKAGKKTFALVENILIPRESVKEYEANLEKYLKICGPEHLAVYYYGHNNEDPEAVQQATINMLQSVYGGRR